MKKNRVIIQLLFLSVFLGLWAVGRIQLWVFIFGAGLVLSLGVGRIYCGWICPMNTVMRGITAIKKKYKLKHLPIPKVFEKTWVRASVLALFFGAFAASKLLGVKVPVLPGLFLVAILLTLVFPERLWHRYLCPYGLLLSVPAKVSKRSLTILSASCNQCGVCSRVCPSNAASKKDGSHQIDKSECLSCGLCEDKCPKKAIAVNQ